MLPTVSIILPTYNRARFLPQALESIRTQQWTDWELIIVDDGSTDETAEIIGELTAGIEQPVKFVRQENQGAYGARNTGLDHATGKYIAFFDSDDEWLPHHLDESVAILESNVDVDWVYSASRIVDLTSGRVLSENCFFNDNEKGNERTFLSLHTESRGCYQLIKDDRAVEVALIDALYAGLQTSVIRASIFRQVRIPPFRVGEDQLLTILALKRGIRIAWTMDVHVIYYVHADSISAGASKTDLASVKASREFVRAFESLFTSVHLTPREVQVLRARLSSEYFWNLGYRLQLAGNFGESRKMFRAGITYRPFVLGFWKTYFTSYAKQSVQSLRKASLSLSGRKGA